MTHWLYPANVKFYDVFAAFAQEATYWPMNSKVSIGDAIYIYLAAPYKQVGFVATVDAINLPHAAVIGQVRLFIKGEPKAGKQDKLFMQLKVLSTVAIDPASGLSYTHLKNNGLNGMLMGPRKLENNPELLTYFKGLNHGLC
jgi:hypothetical protein